MCMLPPNKMQYIHKLFNTHTYALEGSLVRPILLFCMGRHVTRSDGVQVPVAFFREVQARTFNPGRAGARTLASGPVARPTRPFWQTGY